MVPLPLPGTTPQPPPDAAVQAPAQHAFATANLSPVGHKRAAPFSPAGSSGGEREQVRKRARRCAAMRAVLECFGDVRLLDGLPGLTSTSSASNSGSGAGSGGAGSGEGSGSGSGSGGAHSSGGAAGSGSGGAGSAEGSGSDGGHAGSGAGSGSGGAATGSSIRGAPADVISCDGGGIELMQLFERVASGMRRDGMLAAAAGSQASAVADKPAAGVAALMPQSPWCLVAQHQQQKQSGGLKPPASAADQVTDELDIAVAAISKMPSCSPGRQA